MTVFCGDRVRRRVDWIVTLDRPLCPRDDGLEPIALEGFA